MNTYKQFEIQHENVGGILFDIDVQKSDNAIADIANLDKIRIDLTLKRAGNKEPIVIYKGFLGRLLDVLYTQSTQLELVKKKLASGYKVLIDFKNLPITLLGEDKLILDVNFPTSAFTAAVVANSTVTIETIEAYKANTSGVIAIYEDFVVGDGKSSFDENLGSNVAKIFLAIDDAASYDASNKAKPEDVVILASGDYSKKQTQNSLIAQNMHLQHYAPTRDVKHLWLFNSQSRLLNNVTCRITFDKAVGASSVIMVQRLFKS